MTDKVLRKRSLKLSNHADTSSFKLFETIENRRSTVITKQCCVCLSTTSCSREELNKCLTGRYVRVYDKVKFAKFGT